MSKQTMDDVWAPIHARYAEEVSRATWGHLAPQRNTTYRGYITFAVSEYDDLNPTILSCSFKTRGGLILADSPWFFAAMYDFISDAKHQSVAGNVYRFDGTWKNYEFRGAPLRLLLKTTEA